MNACCCCPDTQPLQTCNLTTDVFCGNFELSCKCGPVTIWSLDSSLIDAHIQTIAAVSIYYEFGCFNSVNVLIEKQDGTIIILDVERQNTRSVNLLNIVSISIDSPYGPNRCRGKYCINLHYDGCKVLEGCQGRS